MTLKKQVKTLKENWLILVLVLVVVVILNGNFFGNGISYSFGKNMGSITSSQERLIGYGMDAGFAPEVEERVKTTTTSLSTEVERGHFSERAETLKMLVGNYNAYLLNEDVRKSDTGFRETYYGSYTIKVDVSEYERFIVDLKNIGEVQSFSENVDDITGQYTDLQIELELEKDKLTRYQNLYKDAEDIEDKITLEGMIASQERTVKYLEDRINNLDKRIDYATVYFSLNEERSEYSSIVFVKLSELVKSFVESVNSLLKLFFVVIPWAIVAWILWFVYRKFKR